MALHPHDARVLESLGEAQFGDGQFVEADAAFTEAIGYGRSDWMVQYKRAMTRLELGQLDLAAADIAAAAQQSPNFPGLNYARGILLLKQEQPEQALADLLLYLRERPKDPQAAYLAGTALYQLGRYHESEEYLERAYRAAPETPTRAAALAAVRLARKDFAGAEALLRPFADQPDAAPGIQELLGQAVRGQGRAAEARDLLTAAVTARPDGAMTRLRLAESMLAAGDPVGAEPELRAVLQASPANQIARLMLIRIYLEKPDPKAALTEAEALIAIAPKDPRALNALGLAHQVNGDPAAARTAFARALKSEPGFADAAFNLVAAARREPDPQVAGALCEQVLAAQPGHANAILLLAQLEVTAGRRKAALDRLSEALAKESGNLALRLNLARGYLPRARSPPRNASSKTDRRPQPPTPLS
ncbi:tetratricopeptide repeat protein [uncultured Lamprocystis sp.]|uniref:tetratricopeptide repeat protein n=1 Tax=uncultured Lamprocystis sp. TaxID=543132 RepID=UPI0025CBF20E|nr:tetratricopeptide repeat protein [uncultured Lamprocystis sp.]